MGKGKRKGKGKKKKRKNQKREKRKKKKGKIINRNQSNTTKRPPRIISLTPSFWI